MSSLSHEEANPPPEVEEPLETVKGKCRALAAFLAGARHPIAFTGAGISTTAGIPDFRGPTGAWTMKAQGKAPLAGVPISMARPTFAHMATRSLFDLGLLAHVVSQNTDGLHLRSGLPVSGLSELHGDSYLAVCWEPGCGHKQLSDTPVRSKGRNEPCESCRKRVPYFCHCLSIACPHCASKGKRVPLRDSIIHFKENLDSRVLSTAFGHAEKADFCLVLGSSCKVTPAADVPQSVGMKRLSGDKGANLVIVNLQPTPLDGIASLIIRAKIDTVMALLMEELGLLDTVQYPWAPPRGLPTPLPQAVTGESPTTSTAASSSPFKRGLALVKSKMTEAAFEAAKAVTERPALVTAAAGGRMSSPRSTAAVATKPAGAAPAPGAKAFTVVFPKGAAAAGDRASSSGLTR